MEIKFYTQKCNLDKTQKIIRSLDSLRFLGSPLIIGDEAHISISGNVNDMNKLNRYLSFKDGRIFLEP
jgi:hypothetical protein